MRKDITVWGRPETTTAPERQAMAASKQPTTQPPEELSHENQTMLRYDHTPKGAI